jgi:hypothetical protein
MRRVRWLPLAVVFQLAGDQRPRRQVPPEPVLFPGDGIDHALYGSNAAPQHLASGRHCVAGKNGAVWRIEIVSP